MSIETFNNEMCPLLDGTGSTGTEVEMGSESVLVSYSVSENTGNFMDTGTGRSNNKIL